MAYGSMDDIILKGPDYNNKNKKSKKGKGALIFFLLLLILGGAAAGYWYYTNYIVQTPKKIFFKYVGQTNINNVLNIDIYYDMLDKINNQSFTSETSADITSTKETEFTEGLDVSKFDFALKIGSNKTSNKFLLDGKISYSSNDLFSVKLLNTKDSIGIASDEIYDKYIATSKTDFNESINKTTGVDVNFSADVVEDTLDDISTNKIKMEDNYKKEKADDYLNTIYNLVPEESVTEKENVQVTLGTEMINTNAYTLSLDSEKYKEITKTILEKIKNDDALLNEIVTGEEKEQENNDNQGQAESKVENVNTINTIPNIQTSTEITEGEIEVHEMESTIGEETPQLEINSEPETILVDETSLDTTTIPAIEMSSDELSSEKNEEEEDIYSNFISALILGQKIEGTVQDIKDKIDNEIKKVSSIKEGIKITVYVANEEGKDKNTIKVVAELPQKTNLDIEYADSNKFKVTYLAPDKDDEGKEISAGDSIEIERKSADVDVKYSIQHSSIENKKVVSKTQIELSTNNANPSKGYTNNAIIKYNDKDGDVKLNIKNEIKFGEDSISEELTEENTVFLDKLSEEEANELYSQLFLKAFGLYIEKMQSLKFIDNNSSSSIIQQPEVEQVNKEEKEKIKKDLIEKVSTMMGEAQSRGETFTIQNLVDLSIEGYSVSCIVSEDLAVIKINGYTFNIDKEFMLSE